MNKDKLEISQNPTPEIEQLKDELMKVAHNVLKEQMDIIEMFLIEFCEVNGIDESEVGKHVQVAVCTGDNSVMVVNTDDIRDTKFGVKVVCMNEGFFFDVFGEYLSQKESYPKTTKLIDDGGRNLILASGE